MQRKKVRNQTSFELRAWLESPLSAQDHAVARESDPKLQEGFAEAPVVTIA